MIPDTTPLSQLTKQEIADLAERTLAANKPWLAEATLSTDPAPYTQFWRWTAELYRAARRSNVPQQAWQDAQELIRRAERALAQSIRAGQHSGRIRLPSERASEGHSLVARRASLHQHKVSPRIYATSAVLNNGPNGIYCFADNVSDERFDAAIAAARNNNNLSRGGMISQLGLEFPSNSKHHRIKLISRLAISNHTTRQIAQILKVRTDVVTELAREAGIDIPANRSVGPKTRRIDPTIIIQETITALEGLAVGLTLIEPGDYDTLPPEQIAVWKSSLAQSTQAIVSLRKELDRVLY